MSQNRALIVDDSRTAQARLRKLLECFDLQVDTAFSAEEAFGYLSYRHPAVVFLDHHMEGMDGLAALKIIKSNPDTALIPVIMYTSEQGDVYVGQARALGAIDIIGKEVIKQANLEKVLGSLGIEPAVPASDTPVDNTPESPAAPKEEVPAPKLTPAPKPVADALDDVQRQVSKLFELHITKVRQEIEDSSKFVLRRITKELQDKNKSKPAPASVADVVPVMAPVVEPEKRSAAMLVMGLILLVMAFAGYHLYINNQHQELA